MKVAVVYQYYQGHGAPGHSLVYELTQFLAERGHRVTVVSGETGYMRRDMPTLLATLAALDRHSLATKRPITVSMLRGWLNRDLDLDR